MAMDEDWGGWDSGSSFGQGSIDSFTDFGSFDPSSYQDPYAGAGGQYGPAATGSVAQDVLGAGGTLNAQGVPQGGSNWGGAAMPGAPGAQGLGFGGMGLQGLLGLGGAGAGLLGALMGGGLQSRQMPQIGTAQKAAINQAPQGLSPFAQGTSPLQMQQSALLNAIFQGQVPPQLANLVQNAYSPVLQQLQTRATEAGRNAGFYDAPGTSPVGGAILGPGLAQVQGQEANSILGLMQSVPGLYNTPINQQAQAAGQQGNQLLSGAGLGIGQQNTGNLPQQIGAQVGGALQGAGQAIGQNQQIQRQLQGQGGIGTTGSYY